MIDPNFLLKKSIQRKLKNKKILVTGGTGMLGREVIRLLLACDAKITSVSLDKLKIRKKIKNINGDLRDFKFCKHITKNQDYVFHLAGIKASIKITIERPATFFVPLLMMNTNILEACRINKIKKIVFTSSIGAYHSSSIFREKEFRPDSMPMDFYPGWAKRMAELQIKSYYEEYKNLNFSIVRPSNVFGPGDNFDERNAMVIPSLISRIVKGESPVKIWGDGSAVRDFIYVSDCAAGVIHALVYGTKADFVNLGSGKGVSIKKLVNTLRSVKKFNYFFDKNKPSGFKKRILDMSKANKEIKFKTKVDLKTALKITFDWFVKNKSEFKKRYNYFN